MAVRWHKINCSFCNVKFCLQALPALFEGERRKVYKKELAASNKVGHFHGESSAQPEFDWEKGGNLPQREQPGVEVGLTWKPWQTVGFPLCGSRLEYRADGAWKAAGRAGAKGHGKFCSFYGGVLHLKGENSKMRKTKSVGKRKGGGLLWCP